ncbi:MAG: hypothetical protein ISS10_02225, partial [Candidatus Marinimicrobia bacterium]|nr:hypothetical protein [Candidatus Neomarinimicrobiota bacterium]
MSLKQIALYVSIISSVISAPLESVLLSEDKTEIKLLNNTSQEIVLNYHIEKIDGFTVETMGGSFSEITLPSGHSVGLIGNPKLPARKELIEIPEGAEVSVEVLGYSVTEVKLIEYGYTHPLMPVQPSMSKSQEVQDVPFEKDVASYNVDRYTEHPLATVEVLGRLRGVRLARVVVAPIQYNPQRNMIKIYNDLEVKINLIGGDENQTDYIKQSTYSPYFDVVYEQILNNRDHDYPNHPDLTKYPVKYLIVSDPMFENTLQPFIEWKIKKGFEVIVGYTNEIGSSVSSIQNWLWDHYDAGTPEDPAPSFILFVGDVQQIPASATGSSTNKKTDLYYGSVDGDYFPEMYYGRFSATTVSQLQAQIDKTLYYEKYQFDNPEYLDDVTLIAGADGTWNPNVGQPTVQYGTENYFNAAYGFDEVHDYLTSYSGCYDTVDDGVGFINYTAHCGETEWSSPHLSQSDVNNFTNVNKYPLAIGNCCLAADFGYSECIGETWMRKANGGAVAYIGSSPSSYWFEDFYWSVGAFPIQGDNNGYVPTYEETTLGVYDAPFVSDYVTADALIFVGNLAVTEVDIQGYPSHSSPLYYWQAYNLLGDPSLMPYMTQGEVNTVDYMDILPIGVDFFEVSADPGSYVAISFDGNLHGTAIVGETGSVEVSITPILDGGMADIVVTKPQYQPFMTQIQVAPLDGPFITIDSYVISTDDDDTIEFGETVSVNVTLKNVGTESATDVNMTLTMSDFFINLTDDSQGFGTIPAGGFSTQENAYEFIVSTSVTNAYNFS